MLQYERYAVVCVACCSICSMLQYEWYPAVCQHAQEHDTYLAAWASVPSPLVLSFRMVHGGDQIALPVASWLDAAMVTLDSRNELVQPDYRHPNMVGGSRIPVRHSTVRRASVSPKHCPDSQTFCPASWTCALEGPPAYAYLWDVDALESQ